MEVTIGGAVRESKVVPPHTTEVLRLEGWTFWRVRTGCIRVQRGDFTAYLQEHEAKALASFIYETDQPWGFDTE